MSKVWLVTGAARGLGRAISEAVLAAGDRLGAGARDPSRLADLRRQHGDRLRTIELDVTDEAAAARAVELARSAFGRLDVLVNNAGYGHTVPFEQMAPADFRDQVETNLFGVVNLTRAALPVMRVLRAGHIFQVSSVGGRTTTAGLSAYQAAKWAVGGFSDVLGEPPPIFLDGVVALIRLADVTFTRHRPSDASVNDSGLCVDSRFLASRRCA
ncbi:MAG: SDR family NAD(P)-dependent oxidoreductase, partial [Burkholderia sp.]